MRERRFPRAAGVYLKSVKVKGPGAQIGGTEHRLTRLAGPASRGGGGVAKIRPAMQPVWSYRPSLALSPGDQ